MFFCYNDVYNKEGVIVNNKGFAVSGIVYSVLILFFLLIFGVLGVLGSRKLILDKMKNEIMNELNDEVYNNIYMDDSGANYPRLVDQMIPVLYDEDESSWVYADVYEKWYDYDEKMWANAVVLKNGVTKTVGQKIEEDEIALMYVWIPRFKYVMFNANNESVEEQLIDVIFENNKNTTGTVKCVDAINQTDANGNKISEICSDNTNGIIMNGASTYTHPAFTFGNEEIEGFWIGKFENSTTDSECLSNASTDTCNNSAHVLEIKSNSDSLRYINISNMFTSIQNINYNYGINDADSHMIKNMEWGAVAYLTQSNYGRCTNGVCEEVTINNVKKDETYYTMQTGCAANSISENFSTTCQNEYNTPGGFKASTTGNIYGIYDISGGAWEFVMGVMANNGLKNTIIDSEINSNLDEKYYDLYTYDTSNDTYTRGKLGDATYEILKSSTVGWYADWTSFLNGIYSIMHRGGYFDNTTFAGPFYYNRNNGTANASYGSRSILIKQ